MRWSPTTTGVRPIARPTAMTVRTRAGIILLENSGAIRNSGEMRASTRKKPASCCSPKCCRSRSAKAKAASADAHELRDAQPQVLAPGEQLVEHPRPGDQQHR